MLKINNVTVAEPRKEGVTITDEPIWAPNTGRGADGKMVGDIVCWKRTIQVEWNPLTFNEAQTIRQAISNAPAFFTLVFSDVEPTSEKYQGANETPAQAAAKTVSATVYCSNIPRTIYSLSTAHQRHTGVTVTFIEQ